MSPHRSGHSSASPAPPPAVSPHGTGVTAASRAPKPTHTGRGPPRPPAAQEQQEGIPTRSTRLGTRTARFTDPQTAARGTTALRRGSTARHSAPLRRGRPTAPRTRTAPPGAQLRGTDLHRSPAGARLGHGTARDRPRLRALPKAPHRARNPPAPPRRAAPPCPANPHLQRSPFFQSGGGGFWNQFAFSSPSHPSTLTEQTEKHQRSVPKGKSSPFCSELTDGSSKGGGGKKKNPIRE